MIYAIIILTIFILTIILMYNSLINKKNQVDSIFSTVDILLQKRYDLIPTLVTIVKAYAKHEKEIFENIARLRNQANSSCIDNNQKVSIDDKITSAMTRILAIAEGYPELKASKHFLNLQAALCEIEEQISAARRAYNAMVTDYNNAIQSIPTNIIARAMKYREKKLFTINLQNTNFFN